MNVLFFHNINRLLNLSLKRELLSHAPPQSQILHAKNLDENIIVKLLYINANMSFHPSIWPAYYNSGEAVDDNEADNNEQQEPPPFFGRLFLDTGLTSEEHNEAVEMEHNRSRRRSSSADIFPNDGSCVTPQKAKGTECQHPTPQTEDTSKASPADDSLMTMEGSPYCGSDLTDLVHTMSSFMGNSSDDEDVQPQGSHRDRMIFQLCRTRPQQEDPKKKVPDFSLRDTEREALLKEKKNLSFFAYGRVLTIASIIFAIVAIVLAVLSKRSLFFVQVEKTIEISPQLNQVEYVGLVQMKLCYNDTANERSDRWLETTDGPFARFLSTQSALTADAGQGVDHHEQTGCFILPLTVDTIDDKMWNVSRTFLSLAIALGSFLTVMLCFAVYWESINLKPIAVGMLVTYFCQSLSFFFFDSALCRQYSCHLAEGSILSILASLLWFLSGLCVIRMDVTYQAKQRQWARRRKRAIKKMRLQRQQSEATAATTTMTDEIQSPERRNLTFIFDVESQEVVRGADDDKECGDDYGDNGAEDEQQYHI